MQEIVNMTRIDERLGYKLTRFASDGSAKEEARYRCFDGVWKIQIGNPAWHEVPSIESVPDSLRAWRKERECQVTLWACCGCASPEDKAFHREVVKAGGRLSHGFCPECAEKFLKE